VKVRSLAPFALGHDAPDGFLRGATEQSFQLGIGEDPGSNAGRLIRGDKFAKVDAERLGDQLETRGIRDRSAGPPSGHGGRSKAGLPGEGCDRRRIRDWQAHEQVRPERRASVFGFVSFHFASTVLTYRSAVITFRRYDRNASAQRHGC
jgi:hypothetical protein